MFRRQFGESEFLTYERFDGFPGVTSLVTTRRSGDMADADNRERILAALGVGGSFARGRQIHDSAVAVVTTGDRGRIFDATDALITDVPDIPLLILVADCVALSFYDPRTGAVGIAHAGWRGTLAGIAGKTVSQMQKQYGCLPRDIVAGISPSIGPCCYEVGDEVVADFQMAHPGTAPEIFSTPEFASAGSFPGKVNDSGEHLDLWRANELQLLDAGLREGNIDTAGICTACNTDIFYSFRAEKGLVGRFAAVALLHGETSRRY